jgi:hypothetical protein
MHKGSRNSLGRDFLLQLDLRIVDNWSNRFARAILTEATEPVRAIFRTREVD